MSITLDYAVARIGRDVRVDRINGESAVNGRLIGVYDRDGDPALAVERHPVHIESARLIPLRKVSDLVVRG